MLFLHFIFFFSSSFFFPDKTTTMRDGDGDSWVEKDEFKALLRNLLFFNKTWDVFAEMDSNAVSACPRKES